jgi:hypothetical protein
MVFLSQNFVSAAFTVMPKSHESSGCCQCDVGSKQSLVSKPACTRSQTVLAGFMCQLFHRTAANNKDLASLVCRRSYTICSVFKATNAKNCKGKMVAVGLDRGWRLAWSKLNSQQRVRVRPAILMYALHSPALTKPLLRQWRSYSCSPLVASTSQSLLMPCSTKCEQDSRSQGKAATAMA